MIHISPSEVLLENLSNFDFDSIQKGLIVAKVSTGIIHILLEMPEDQADIPQDSISKWHPAGWNWFNEVHVG